eukprot:SAG31_NODE_12220_length_958_cov_0.817229_1_plen_161_part_00
MSPHTRVPVLKFSMGVAVLLIFHTKGCMMSTQLYIVRYSHGHAIARRGRPWASPRATRRGWTSWTSCLSSSSSSSINALPRQSRTVRGSISAARGPDDLLFFLKKKLMLAMRQPCTYKTLRTKLVRVRRCIYSVSPYITRYLSAIVRARGPSGCSARDAI